MAVATQTLRTIARRWRRNLLSGVAMAVSIAAITTILGVTDASALRLAQQVDAYTDNVITASLPERSWTEPDSELLAQFERLPGVTAVGTLTLPDVGTKPADVEDRWHEQSARVSVVIATDAGLRARGAAFLRGTVAPDSLAQRDPDTAVIGTELARELSVDSLPGRSTIYVDDQLVAVTGVIEDAPGSSLLTTALVLSPAAASHLGFLPPTHSIIAATDKTHMRSLADAFPAAVYPSAPQDVTLAVPPSPEQLRDQLVGNSRALVLAISVVMLLATVFGIITTMRISVWERRREIGLSRALGMRRRDIAFGFLTESAVLGALSGIVGWTLGIAIAAGAALANNWTLTFPPEIALLPFVGAFVGALAGALPAWSASRVDPMELLRD